MLILELHKMSLFRNIHLKLLCYQMTYSTDLIYQYVEKDIYFILFLLTKNVKNKIPKLQSSIFCLPQLQLCIDFAAYKASIYIPSVFVF
jgi:hypothetical protein